MMTFSIFVDVILYVKSVRVSFEYKFVMNTIYWLIWVVFEKCPSVSIYRNLKGSLAVKKVSAHAYDGISDCSRRSLIIL